MPERNLVQGYASAILEIARAEGQLDQVEDELYRFVKALEQQGALREALIDPTLPSDRKRAVLEDLLGSRASRRTVALLEFLVDLGLTRELPRIVSVLGELAAEQRQAQVAEIRTAVPLDGPQRKELVRALTRATGRQVELKVLVDPSLLGGIVARVGDQVFDGSVRRRLEMARQQIASMR